MAYVRKANGIGAYLSTQLKPQFNLESFDNRH